MSGRSRDAVWLWRYVGFPLIVLAAGVLAGVGLALVMEGLG